jgi:hypothetical protein
MLLPLEQRPSEALQVRSLRWLAHEGECPIPFCIRDSEVSTPEEFHPYPLADQCGQDSYAEAHQNLRPINHKVQSPPSLWLVEAYASRLRLFCLSYLSDFGFIPRNITPQSS